MDFGRLKYCIPAIFLMAFFACAQVKGADTPVSDTPTASSLLAEAENAKGVDYALFSDNLRQLKEGKVRLTQAQQWHLVYLQAWQDAFEGRYEGVAAVLQEVIDHTNDASLSVRATALLVHTEFLSRHYEKAYILAGTLVAKLPEVSDPLAKQQALSQVVQMMNDVGQHQLALKYARQMESLFPAGKNRCLADLAQVRSLRYVENLTSASPEFQKVIDSCLAVGQVVPANALRLDLAGQLYEEGHFTRAITLLRDIEPSIRESEYRFHVASLHATLAMVYAGMREDAKARKFALAALAENSTGAVNWTVRTAELVLFQIAKRRGDADAALSHYEKYVTQKQDSADDAKARALAYQMVKQDVLAKKMKLDALNKQNRILQLRQTVSEKATETSRLYITLLLIVTASIGFWLYRIKHSQLRFQRLSQHDGMTGAFNRKHFLDVASHSLLHLQKSHTSACLVLLDLDHFKQVNDSHGHAIGDDVLTRTVAICQAELRESDIFGRLGGEEFGILMPSCSCEQGAEVANRIRSTLAAARIILQSGKVVKVSASFGLSCSSISGYALPHLLSVADAALYRAKNAGRNQLVVGTDKDEHHADVANGDAAARA